jgi:hypothetical protein
MMNRNTAARDAYQLAAALLLLVVYMCVMWCVTQLLQRGCNAGHYRLLLRTAVCEVYCPLGGVCCDWLLRCVAAALL